jgi:eukaryotic-like serine/threonine-protein kinase
MWQYCQHPCEHGRGMTDGETPCVQCGAPLAPGAGACPACGAARGAASVPSAVGPLTTPEAVDIGAPIVAAAAPEAATHKRVPLGAADAGFSAQPETQGDGREEARFKTGQKILRHYSVVRQLGKGGMGTVYLARDEVSGQEVAVKVLPGALARERDIRERFTLEARALASMDHPNIVPLVTFAQEGEDRFLVMKYVAGESLDARIRRLGVMPPEHARKVLRAMLSALGYAHARGVIHRDVKPSNVLIEGDLDGEHRVFLVDFGIAKKEEGGKRLTQTGMLMGTPQYMSPEQIGGLPVDRRADLYAAGLVLFEMLAGRPPFDGQKTFQILRAHVEQPVPDVREARGGALPDDLVALTSLLLRKDPAERPSDAGEAIGLLDGTGSFPVLRPEEGRRAPPATAAPTPATTMMSRPHLEPPTGAVDASLHDPSMEELAAIRPRRGGLFLGSLLVLVAGAALWHLRPWESAAFLAATAPSVDAAEEERGLTVAVLIVNARDALERKELDRARVIVDAVLEQEPDNLKARSLRVDALLGGNAFEDAAKTLEVLKEKLAARPDDEEPEIRERLASQERALEGRPGAERRGAAAADDAREGREGREARPREKARRPSELPQRALREVTSSTNASIKLCYEEHIQAHAPRAQGEVVLKVTVRGDGAVGEVEIKSAASALRGGEFQACLKREVEKWRFRPFAGEPDSFVHKFAFRPSR